MRVLFAALAFTTSVATQCDPTWQSYFGLPGVDGEVRASLRWDPDGAGPASPELVVGGRFFTAGTTSANCIASYDPATLQWRALGSGLSGGVSGPIVHALAVLPNGDLAVGGSFTHAGGVACQGVARWNGTTWQPFGSGVGGQVLALTVAGNGDLVAGGHFAGAGSSTATDIARWNGTDWAPLGAVSATSGGVYALTTLPNGDIVAGGLFSSIGGIAAAYAARWTSGTWQPLPGLDDAVFALAVHPSGNLHAGGRFHTAGGQPCGSKVATWNGWAWQPFGLPWSSGQGLWVEDLTFMSSGEVVVAAVNSGSSPSIVRSSGGAWFGFGPGVAGNAYTVTALPGGQLLAGGPFVGAGNTQARFVSLWNGSQWQACGAGFSGELFAVNRTANGDLVVAGQFTSIAGVPAANVARFDGTLWHPLGSGLPGPAASIFPLPDGGLLVSHQAGFQNTISRWNGSTWNSLTPPTYPVSFLRRQSGELIYADDSTLHRWTGSGWQQFGPTSSGVIRAFELRNGDLVVTGGFGWFGTWANRIVRFDGTQWLPLGAGLPSEAYCLLELANGDLLAGGYFGFGTAILRWNGSTWQPFGPPTNGIRTMLALPTGEVLAAGEFSGTYHSSLLRGNGTTWTAPAGGIQPGVIYGLHRDANGDILVAGTFTQVAATMAGTSLARLEPGCRAAVEPLGAGCTTGGTLVTNALPWLGTTLQAHCSLLPTNGLAVGIVGFSATALPLASLLPEGLPGCTLDVVPDVVQLFVPSNGNATMSIPLPAAANLGGVALHLQFGALQFAPGGALQSVASSNALRAVLGLP